MGQWPILPARTVVARRQQKTPERGLKSARNLAVWGPEACLSAGQIGPTAAQAANYTVKIRVKKAPLAADFHTVWNAKIRSRIRGFCASSGGPVCK